MLRILGLRFRYKMYIDLYNLNNKDILNLSGIEYSTKGLLGEDI